MCANDLELAANLLARTHDDRLHETLRADRLCKLCQLFVAEILARIERARPDLRNRHHPLLAFRRQPRAVLHRLTNERGEAPAKTAFRQSGIHGFRVSFGFFFIVYQREILCSIRRL